MAANVDIVINAQDNASSVFGNFTVTLGDVMNIAGKVAGAVTDFFGSTIKQAEEQQDANAQLEAGLKSTGGAAGVTMQQMQDLADAQAKVTTFSDDQTAAIEKIALTFTSVNKDVFPDTIRLSEDMAARLGGDGTAAMTMIGKAMDDPVKGLGALHKVGVSFTEQQKDQIKALVAAGDTMGAQKILLAELSKEYGGSAAAAGATFAGQQQILAHQFDEVKEKIGTALLPVLGQLTGVITTNVLPIVQRFAEWFSANLPIAIDYVSTTVIPKLTQAWNTIQPTVQTVIGILTQVIQSFQSGGDGANALGQTITTLSGYWTALQPVITNVVNAVQQVVMAVFGVIQEFIKAHGADISATMQDAWTRIQAIIKTGIELYNAIVPPVLKFIAKFIHDHGTEIQAILSSTWNAIKAVIDAALTLIQGVITVALDIIHGDWSKAWEDIKAMSARIVEDILSVIKADFEILKTLFSGTVQWINDEWHKLPGQLADVGTAIVSAIETGLNSAWEEFKASMLKKLADLRAQLPFSEPKDTSSPLYGLGKSGASIVRNMQEGIDGAPSLRIGSPTIASSAVRTTGAASSTGAGGAPSITVASGAIVINTVPGQSTEQIAQMVITRMAAIYNLRRA